MHGAHCDHLQERFRTCTRFKRHLSQNNPQRQRKRHSSKRSSSSTTTWLRKNPQLYARRAVTFTVMFPTRSKKKTARRMMTCSKTKLSKWKPVHPPPLLLEPSLRQATMPDPWSCAQQQQRQMPKEITRTFGIAAWQRQCVEFGARFFSFVSTRIGPTIQLNRRGMGASLSTKCSLLVFFYSIL